MNDSKDKKQLKFIEILLIVGGIIGGLGFKGEDSKIKVIFAFFLITSLMYYSTISNKHNSNIFAFLTSILFSALITYPIISGTPLPYWNSYPSAYKVLNAFFATSIFIVIYRNLEEKMARPIYGSILIYISGIIITLAYSQWLSSS